MSSKETSLALGQASTQAEEGRVGPAARPLIPHAAVRAGAQAICLPSAWHTGDSDPQRAAALSTAHSVLRAAMPELTMRADAVESRYRTAIRLAEAWLDWPADESSEARAARVRQARHILQRAIA